MSRIDLNADLGEGCGDDAALLTSVTSANVACGFHAGGPTVMAETVAAAVANGVVVGAHVSYPDREGFGRREMTVSAKQLRADVLYQLGALDALARAAGTRVRYVKPHGALYHRVAADEATARALLAAVRDYDPGLLLLTLPGSVATRCAAAAGVAAVGEAFADRGYTPDGRLVPREQPGALLTDPEEVARRGVRLATEGVVRAVDGSNVQVAAGSLCLHGDTPGAVELARRVRDALTAAGVTVTAFA